MARAPIRPARVSSVLREALAQALSSEVHDPRVAGVIVTEVEVSGDLQEARVYFHVDGDARRVAEAAEGLDRASGFLRRYVGDRVRLRMTPRLTFRHDASLEYAARIETRLAELGLGAAAVTEGETGEAAEDADEATTELGDDAPDDSSAS